MNITPNSIIEKIHEYRDKGVSKRRTANDLNLDYGTVRKWWNQDARVIQPAEVVDLKSIKCGFESHHGHQISYSYLLGLYLGDGYINVQNQKFTVYKLRITQDQKYPGLINEHITAMENIFQGNKANVCSPANSKSCDVYIYSKHILDLFPQHGAGPKNSRPIVLLEWQTDIIKKYPEPFIRGLIQTDGSRYVQNQKGRKYIKYNFTNTSKDIVDLFCSTCDELNIHWTIHSRPSTKWDGSKNSNVKYTVTINCRKDVERMEDIVGIKR